MPMPDSASSLRRGLVAAVAGGWIALGCQLEGEPERDIVDIEGLVVATSLMGSALDARTREAAADWSAMHAWAISGTRLSRVAREMAADGEAVGRWGAEGRGRVVLRDLAGTARLALRLRAAIGTSSRADILAILLGSPVPLSVAEIGRRVRYTKHAVAVAVEAMALAGLVETARVGREVRVGVGPDSLVRPCMPRGRRELVDPIGRWRAALGVLAVLERTAGLPGGARAVEQRAAVAALLPLAIAGGLPRVDTGVTGEAFADEFERWADAIGREVRPAKG